MISKLIALTGPDREVDCPQLKRGMVWCTVCGRTEKVDGADCLRHGWPECHGFTMTIDSPEERAGRSALREAGDA